MSTKFALASELWLRYAREQLKEIARIHGSEDVKFSLCEVFVGAPNGSIGMRSPGRAAWHFRIDGQSATAEPGEVEDVDVKLVLDYEETLPYARLVVDGERESGPTPHIIESRGDIACAPPFLRELHNRLAVRTE